MAMLVHGSRGLRISSATTSARGSSRTSALLRPSSVPLRQWQRCSGASLLHIRQVITARSPSSAMRASAFKATNGDVELASYLLPHEQQQQHEQQQTVSLLEQLTALAQRMLRRTAAVLMLAPLLLLSLATPPAAHARRSKPAPAPAATVATAPTAADSTTQVWRPSIEPSKLTQLTTLQTVDTLLHTPEGQTITRITVFILFMWVVTRRPDPAPSKPSPNPYAAVTKSWVITRGEGGVVKAREVDPASLPKPPRPSPPPVRSADKTSSIANSSISKATSTTGSSMGNASSNGTGPSAATSSTSSDGSTVTVAKADASKSSSSSNASSNGVPAESRAASPPSRAASPVDTIIAGSPEPGVIGLSLTAAAIDTFAPLGKFVLSDMMAAVAALSSPSTSNGGSGNDSINNNNVGSSNAVGNSGSGNNASGASTAAAAAPTTAPASLPGASAAGKEEVAAAERTLAHTPEAGAKEPLSGVQLVDWAVTTTQNAKRQQQQQLAQALQQPAAAQQQQPAAAQQPAAQAQAAAPQVSQGPTPLKLDPRYPPSKAQQPPRPVSLTTDFRAGAGATASEQVSSKGWAQRVYEPPLTLPDLDLDVLAAATVSSVVALNLAVATRQRTLPDLATSPTTSYTSATAAATAGGERRVSQVVAANLAEAARKLVAQRAQQQADREAAARAAAEAAAAKLAVSAPPPFTFQPPAVIASAAAATTTTSASVPGTAATATGAPSAASSSSSQASAGSAATAASPAVTPSSSAPAVAASQQAQAGSSSSTSGAGARSVSPPPRGPSPTLVPRVKARSSSPDALRPAATEVDGSVVFTSDQLQAVEVVIEEVRSKLQEASRSPSPCPAGSPAPRQQEAVARWTEMIKRSPGSAADAVAEVHAVAQAVMEDVRGSLQAVDSELDSDQTPESLAARAEMANETADALLAGRQAASMKRAWAPWAWAWGMGSSDDPAARSSASRLADFLDPFQALLSLKAPTVRSKYDPVTSLRGWAAKEDEPLPNWDPLQRLRAMRRGSSGGGSAGGASGGASNLGLSFQPAKYDAVSQLWGFLASLPELVGSAEWAAAAAQDPLRLLIADAAGRSESRVLQARARIQKQREAAAGGPVKKKRSRWSKYDPFADIFSPEVPLGGRQIWDDVVSEMLALESVSGPMLKQPFSPLKVMGARGGQAFGSALLDFRRMAVTDEGAARLRRYHPAISAWLQSASNVSLATVASGTKLGPVWGVLLLPRSNYQATLMAAKQALPSFLRELERRHPGLWGLLRQRDPEQALVLLATLAAWVVADSMAATGKPPRALTPPPADEPVTASSGRVSVNTSA